MALNMDLEETDMGAIADDEEDKCENIKKKHDDDHSEDEDEEIYFKRKKIK